MLVKPWGTRGSIPAPAVATARYGGNTPCVEVRAPDGETLILDAGIGLHWLGVGLIEGGFSRRQRRAHILLTHTHWGHIQGLPFFQPMLDGNCRFNLYGSPGPGNGSLRDLLLQQMDSAYCPVPNFFEDRIGARLTIADIDETPFQIGDTRVTPRRVNHVAGADCLGYRLECGGASMAYIPDVEYLEAAHRQPALELAAGAGLLIHDAHFAADEYVGHRGTGHSSDRAAVDLAREAGVGRVLLFHHHPDRADSAIDRIVATHQDCGLSVEAAAERAEYRLGET